MTPGNTIPYQTATAEKAIHLHGLIKANHHSEILMTCKCSHARRLPRREAADFIGKSKATLDNWARTKNKTKTNVKFRIIGNRAYYDIADLDEYLKGQQTF